MSCLGFVHIQNTFLNNIIIRLILIRIERYYKNDKTLLHNIVVFLEIELKIRD